MSAGNNQNGAGALPSIPVIGPLEPWINLIHTVGLPWVIIALSAYYGVPFARDIAAKADAVAVGQAETNKRMENLEGQCNTAMPLLKDAVKAVPLLERIHDGLSDGAKQRHDDLRNLRSELATPPATAQ